MQIVIDIPEEDYEKIRKTSFVENTEIMFKQSSEDRKGTMMLFRIIDAIKNGTKLPKGHGRLIDADELYDQFEDADYDFDKTLEYAPTIIKADRTTIIKASNLKSYDEWMKDNAESEDKEC